MLVLLVLLLRSLNQPCLSMILTRLFGLASVVVARSNEQHRFHFKLKHKKLFVWLFFMVFFTFIFLCFVALVFVMD